MLPSYIVQIFVCNTKLTFMVTKQFLNSNADQWLHVSDAKDNLEPLPQRK